MNNAFSPLFLPAVAIFTNSLEVEISSQESSNNNSYFVRLLGRFSTSSKSPPWINSSFFFAFGQKEVDNVDKMNDFCQILDEM